jgi:hypothetical protein
VQLVREEHHHRHRLGKAMKYLSSWKSPFRRLRGPRPGRGIQGGETPGIYIVKPQHDEKPHPGVDYPRRRPAHAIDVPVVLQNVKTRCTPAYQNLF